MNESPTPKFRRSRPSSVEVLQDRIGVLVARRQTLREQGASPAALERNRRELARCYWQLSLALIARFRPEEEAA
jgi:hypothetical protein